MARYCASDQFLVAALTVGVRAVEKIDADLARAAQGADRRIAVRLIVERCHRRAAETDRGNLESTKPAPLHSFLLDLTRIKIVRSIALLTNRKFREKGKILSVEIPCAVAKVTPEMSPMVEGTGFELWVPPPRSGRPRPPGSARLLLLSEPFHGAGGICRFGASRCCLALGLQLLGLLAVEFIDAVPLHVGIEHFQGSAAGVDLVVMGEIREAFEDTEQVLVPEAAQDFYIAGAALRAERPEPRQLVATFRRRAHREGAQRPHQMLRLAFAGLSRILTKPNHDPLAVLGGGVEQQPLHIARVGPRAQHIQQPIAAVPVAAELDADRPTGVVELGLFGRREIPVADNIQIRRGLVGNGTPFPPEIQPGRRPNLPIAAHARAAASTRARPDIPG